MASSAPRVPRHDFMWTHFHGWHVHPNGEDLQNRDRTRQEACPAGSRGSKRILSTVPVTVAVAAVPRKRQSSTVKTALRRFNRVFFTHCLPRWVLVLITGIFVHVFNLFQYKTTTAVATYLIVSFAVKIFAQELVRTLVLRSKVNDPRTMFAVTAIPTVLFDTQVSIMLQRLENAWTTVSGTVLMAIFEVSVRAFRMVLVHRGLRVNRGPQLGTSSPQQQVTQVVPVAPARLGSGRSRSPEDEERKQHRVLAFHAAEMYAEMSAEYIAIGCSAATLFLGWSHPKYKMGALRDAVVFEREERTTYEPGVWQSPSIFALQIVMELIVDYISCTIEIKCGVDFKPLRRYESFVLAFLACMSVLNIQITAMIYMTIDE